jgi:ABC-type oligopeptide transport system substrate-binding subunit
MGGKMSMAKSGLRFAAVGAVAALALAACGGGSSSSSASGSQGGAAGTPQKGGTLYYLTQVEQFQNLDPQRMYTGEDLAFFGGTIYRTLTNFKFSADHGDRHRHRDQRRQDVGVHDP